MLTKKQLLERLEAIKDGLADTDNRWGIEGVIDDISILMDDIDKEIGSVYTDIGEA
jgi:hypothetical protein